MYDAMLQAKEIIITLIDKNIQSDSVSCTL